MRSTCPTAEGGRLGCPALLPFAPERDDLDAVGPEKRGGYAGQGRQAAGWAAGLEKTEIDLLGPGNGQDHGGPATKRLGQVVAVPVDNPGRVGQYAVSVAVFQAGCRARGGQTAQLFGADRDPVASGQLLQAGRVCLALSIVAGA